MRRRRAFVLMIVLLAVSLCSIILIGLQASSLRQAGQGREAVARVRAKWAARAGVESVIARLAFNVQNPDLANAYRTVDDLADVATGELDGASWTILHDDLDAVIAGPADAHAKININRMSGDDLIELPYMTIDLADAILDWIDPDDIPNQFGAEATQYAQAASPYEPRNGPFRSLFELELVFNVEPEFVRGEDWNLNGRLDANEDDGDATWPPDDRDGILDAGWSAHVTAESVEPGMAVSGQPRLYLRDAGQEALIGRVPSITPDQAEVILTYAQEDDAQLYDFAVRNLTQMAQELGVISPTLRDLEQDDIVALIDECTLFDPEAGPVPGRININTVHESTLDYLISLPDELRDRLIDERNDRASGFVHAIELLEFLSPDEFGTVMAVFDVESNAYVVSSVGRDERSGVEVEITATIERTALPIVITEHHIR